jgi:MYXO-CTERM domain-containing protein
MVYDAHRKRAVLFGGFNNFELDDTWEYGVLSGTCSSAASCDGFACVDGACCEKTQCGPCQTCSSSTARCEAVLGRDDADTCSGDRSCDAAGACRKKNGIGCANGSECVSGNCADGVCCSSACNGACERCDSSESPGTCSYVAGSAHHGSCSGAPPCGATCPGDSPDCVYPTGSSCGSSCTDARITASACNGNGQCETSAPKDCPSGYACRDAQQCAVACEDSTLCSGKLICRAGACVEPSATCKDATTRLDENNQTQSCGEYACRAGKCLNTCGSPQDCAANLICDSSRHCVRSVANPEADGSGCGCRTSSGGSKLSALFGLAALVLARSRRVARAERRRHAPPSS